VTACQVAHPPYVGFIARLRPSRLPGSGARKLPSSTNNLLGWVLPPLVICALRRTRKPHFRGSSGRPVVADFGRHSRSGECASPQSPPVSIALPVNLTRRGPTCGKARVSGRSDPCDAEPHPDSTCIFACAPVVP